MDGLVEGEDSNVMFLFLHAIGKLLWSCTWWATMHTYTHLSTELYVCMYVCTRHAFIQAVPGTMGSCFCCCCCYFAWVWRFVCIVAPLVFPNSGISLECASCNRRLHTRHRHWVRAGINKCARTLNPTRTSEATELLGKGPALCCKDKDDALPVLGMPHKLHKTFFEEHFEFLQGSFFCSIENCILTSREQMTSRV